MATVLSTQKILTSSAEVNTTYGGSTSSKELNAWITVEDLSNKIKPYKVYTALVTQSGSSAPTAIVLENEIGDIVWTRVDTGTYRANLTNAFPPAKTGLIVGPVNFFGGSAMALGRESGDNIDRIELWVLDGFGNNVDGALDKTLVEIRVYN